MTYGMTYMIEKLKEEQYNDLLRNRNELMDCLLELVDLVHDHLAGEESLDSFSTQWAETLLKNSRTIPLTVEQLKLAHERGERQL